MYLLSEFTFGGPTESSTSCINGARCRGGEGSTSQRKRSVGLHCARGRSIRPNSKTSSRSDGGSKGFWTWQSMLNPLKQMVTYIFTIRPICDEFFHLIYLSTLDYIIDSSPVRSLIVAQFYYLDYLIEKGTI